PTIEPTITTEPTVSPEATPTAEVSPTENNNPQNSNQPSDNSNQNNSPSETPTTTPTPAPEKPVDPVIKEVCLTSSETITDSLAIDWNYDPEKDIYETKEKVKLGVKYIFPQENSVTVTFKCLPTNESLLSTLKIKRVKTSDLNLPQDTSNIGEYAYDITTGMVDGIFKYDITLPKTSDTNAGIAYIEKSIDAAKLGVLDNEIKSISETEQQTDKVIGKDINHFTIYIVYMYDNNGNVVVNPTEPTSSHKVTICHATSSSTNPYNEETVDDDSIIKNSGHDDHDDDIIPKFDYQLCPTLVSDFGSYNSSKPCHKKFGPTWKSSDYKTYTYSGKNWDEDSQKILNNNCQNPKTATLVVIKEVKNDNGGAKTAANFTITASGNKISQTSFAGSSTGTTLTLETGAYSVDEITDSGYQKTLSSECAGTITNSDLGKTKTCTITNDDIAPQLKVVKKVVGNNSDRFSLKINNTEYATDIGDNGSTGFITVNAGTATFSETAKNNNLNDYAVTYSTGCDNGQITLLPGDVKTCTITNTRKTGSITVHKFQDDNQNGVQDRGEDNLRGWDMNLYTGNNCDSRNYKSDLDTNSLGDAKFDNLTTGNYSVKEEMPTGWGSVMSVCQNVTVTYQTNLIVNFGNYKLGKIEGIKFYDQDADGERDYRFHYGHKEYSEPTLDDWKIFIDENGDQKYNWGETYEYTDHDGSYDFKNLTPGIYTICEQMQNGWTNSTPLCQTTNLTSGDTDEINFGNYQYGSISGYKWEDINGNGSRDRDCHQRDFRHDDKCHDDNHCEYTEPTIAGWTITLDKGADGSIESTITTDRNGNYRFDQLTPGKYRICEDERRSDGWHNTNGGTCRDITISPGEDEKDVNFGNQKSDPKLNISKSNNTGGSELSPGNSVEYKITLSVSDNSINNLKVTDLLSDGFKYQVSSYRVYLDGVLKNIPEPQYHSPGLWDLSSLGEIKPGQEIELVYTADISSDQQAGKYADLAYASAVYGYDSAKSLLAAATSEGYIDTNYVGTDVTVNRNQQNSISAGVEKTETINGQVLGASTEMPATGASTLWLIISSIIGSLGLILIKRDKITKSMAKKIFSIFILPLFLFLVSDQIVFAESSLSVRLEQPKTPTNIKDLHLKFVALDLNSNAITAKCLKKGPIDSDFSQYGSDIVLSAGGNASQCNTLSAIDRVGSYQFKVEANGVSSNTVSIDYKDIAPGTPTDYRKESLNGNCDFKIHFRTANDEGRTVKVELYRSTDSAFTANNDSLVHSINIGSTQETDINNSVPDCSKTYYYALRAFDNAGNGSDIIGDTITVKTIYNQTSVTGTPSQGAIPVAGSNIPGESDNDQNQSGENQETGNQDQSSGQILGSQTQLGNLITNHKILSSIIAVGLLAIIIYAFKKIRQGKKTFRRK
ncbi:MAG: hypothetical protein KIH89_004475, partial [Candidatus Shapirobacteria bacterium]|nr:hypothetical protein [Candidatus Shapirobacteria bacterium]